MTFVKFDIEAHREGGNGPLTIAAFDATKVRSRARINDVCVSDISEAFNPMPEPLSDFAYRAQFSLSDAFEDNDAAFDALEQLGFDRKVLIAACREAFGRR